MEMQQRNHLHKPDWSNLPTEILQLIAQFLLKPMNLKNFRLVCKNWHFSTLISAFLPRTIISDVPEKVISSSILLLRPHNSPHLNPLIVLAVEPIKGVIKLFSPFTRTLLVNLPENLDLACFRSTRLATAYHVVDDNYEPDMFSSCPYIKVLITWSSPTIPSSRHCCMLTLSDGGKMLKSKPFTEHNVNGKRSPCENADDVVSFLVIDCTFCGKVRRRKRLAVLKSSSAERFLMIVPVNGEGRNLHFKVYMWTRDTYQCVWSEVTSFGKADQVLFVCRYYCFFAAAGKVGNELAVYSLVGQDFYSMPAECYPGFPVILLQSPPPWILPNASSCLQPQFQSGLEEVKMIQQPDSNKEDSQVEESESEHKDQTIDIISTNAAGVQTTSSPVVNDIEHVAEEVMETERLGDTTIQAHHMEHLVQASVKKVVTVKFQGLDVESDHLSV
uniref:F-box domain-containing protein n=1 Tax=Chenopodium quinoa TaxID=63459 RepID=A0A803MFR8_CHEQI